MQGCISVVVRCQCTMQCLWLCTVPSSRAQSTFPLPLLFLLWIASSPRSAGCREDVHFFVPFHCCWCGGCMCVFISLLLSFRRNWSTSIHKVTSKCRVWSMTWARHEPLKISCISMWGSWSRPTMTWNVPRGEGCKPLPSLKFSLGLFFAS